MIPNFVITDQARRVFVYNFIFKQIVFVYNFIFKQIFPEF